MSRSTRRPTTYSRSNGHRALSVTEAVQSIRLTDTVGEHPGGHSSTSYSSPDRRSRHPYRDPYTVYERSPNESSTSSTLNPALLQSRSSAGHIFDPEPSTSTANPYLSTSENMRYVFGAPVFKSRTLCSLTRFATATLGTLHHLLLTALTGHKFRQGLHTMVSSQISWPLTLQVAVGSTK